ncbi:MAG: maleylpyruvate isomerase N-terminal domain-containing protein [Candidatus Dormibacteria bacterium]
MITKTELIAALRTAGTDVSSQLKGLPAESFDRLGDADGWTGKQHLAHIASTEWTIPRLFDLAQADDAAQQAAAAFDNHAYNAKQVGRRAARTVGQLLEEFETNRAATIAAIEAADESLLSLKVSSAGGVHGKLGRVLQYLCVEHVGDHLKEIHAGDPAR